MYRCDMEFALDELFKLYHTYDDYGILLISGSIVQFYCATMVNNTLLKQINDVLPNRQKKGGQSAQRFGRIREEKVNLYLKKIVENMVSLYTANSQLIIKGLIIAGPAEMKHKVQELDLFKQYFRSKVLCVLDTDEIHDNTIHLVKIKCSNLISNETESNQFYYEFERMIINEILINRFIFNKDDTLRLYFENKLERLYLSTSLAIPAAEMQLIMNHQSLSKTAVMMICNSEFITKYNGIVGFAYPLMSMAMEMSMEMEMEMSMEMEMEIESDE
jgi:hypothetical protein